MSLLMLRRVSTIAALWTVFVQLVFAQSGGSAVDLGVERSVLTITATHAGFTAPDTVSEGWTELRLRNDSSDPHMAMVVRLDDDKSLDEFIEVYREAYRTDGPRPEWALRLGGPGVARPNATTNVTQYLRPGRYVLACLLGHGLGEPHLFWGMAAPFVVNPNRGSHKSDAPPQADALIQLVDYAFAIKDSLSAGRQMIRVANLGAQPHEIAMAKLAQGKTMADVYEWARNPGMSAPFAAPNGGISSLAPGADAYFELELTPGEYVLFCFVTAPDGRPHSSHGMLQKLAVGQ